MAFLERLKLRRSAAGDEASADGAPPPLPRAPRLKARITQLGQLFFPARSARRLAPSADLADVPPDPSRILFPVSSAGDDGNDSAGGHQGPLSGRLRHSADSITGRQADLQRQAGAVARAIADRVAGSVSLTAWSTRFFIALVWGGLAAQLAWMRVSDATGPVLGIGAVAADDVWPLLLVFGIASSAGLAAVFLGAAIVSLAGNADNRRIRERGALFGDLVADLALQFDAELDKTRRAMDARANPVDAVADLSRAHLIALEAAVFFRDIQFLTDDDDASLRFRGYLSRSPGGRAGGAELPAFGLGIFTGIIIFSFIYGPPEIEIPALETLAYPAVEAWILIGGFAYLIAGLLAEIAKGLVTGGVAAQARDEALEAVRSGFVARGAPRVDDVIQRIEDSLEVYKARVTGRRSASDSASNSDASDIPHWRRAPEGPRFVDTGFQAAPKTFRADPSPSAGRRSKKIF